MRLILDEYCFTNYLGSASKEGVSCYEFLREKYFWWQFMLYQRNISDYVNKVDFYSAGCLDEKNFRT